MYHRTVIPYPRTERWIHFVVENPRQHHIGIGRRDQEAARFELVDLILCGTHRLAQSLDARCSEMLGLRKLCFQSAQAGQAAGVKRIHQLGLFGPAIARHGLKGGIAWVHCGKSVGVRTICVHIHVSLHENSRALGLRMAQFQDRLAVKEIVPGKQGVQPGQIVLKLG